ncbi:hypothetical protein ONZ45_g1185 [Pleurotus djamor]|nr:hypothetical protein ONZ45_g1185 [Pleurotus djamor]
MSPTPSAIKLFQPTKVGRLALKHRIVLAPMTRLRASDANVPLLPIVKDYYQQRGSTPGTLLITEGIAIAPQAGGFPNLPGLWSDEQIAAWKEVTDAVHAKGSFIYAQIAAIGRPAVPALLAAQGLPYVSASDVPLSTQPDPAPRPLTIPEIKEYVQVFVTAASNAVNRAGFDGVEIHGASGMLIDQFIQDVTNKRIDEYGGSIEGRSKFALEILDAVTKEIGQDRTAIRFSPWSTAQEMRMEDPKPTFSYLVSQLRDKFPDLAYLHVAEPRVSLGLEERDESTIPVEEENDFMRKIWAPKPVITAGGMNRELAIATADRGDIVAVGRPFTSNPDLPVRWEHNYPLTPYDRPSFYLPGDASGKGYSDFSFYSA